MDTDFENWLIGFIEGEGCFCITTKNSSSSKLGRVVSLSFSLAMNSRELPLLEKIKKYLGCGKIYDGKYSKYAIWFWLSRRKDIERLIEICDRNQFHSVTKHQQYIAWKKAYALVKQNEHRTKEGLQKIIDIRTELNTKFHKKGGMTKLF